MREIAAVNIWESTSETKPMIENAERKFDLHMKSSIGINPKLMMPGNYACQLFEVQNTDTLLADPESGQKREIA